MVVAVSLCRCRCRHRDVKPAKKKRSGSSYCEHAVRPAFPSGQREEHGEERCGCCKIPHLLSLMLLQPTLCAHQRLINSPCTCYCSLGWVGWLLNTGKCDLVWHSRGAVLLLWNASKELKMAAANRTFFWLFSLDSPAVLIADGFLKFWLNARGVESIGWGVSNKEHVVLSACYREVVKLWHGGGDAHAVRSLIYCVLTFSRPRSRLAICGVRRRKSCSSSWMISRMSCPSSVWLKSPVEPLPSSLRCKYTG